MNQELVEKGLNYHREIETIAQSLFYLFYDDSNIDLNFESKVKKLMPKAQKILHFFKNSEKAIAAIRFFHTVEPLKSKEIFDLV